MMDMKQHRLVCALLVAMALFAGCKGESPTAPSPTPPGVPPGGTTPPASPTLTVTVSNPTPTAGSNSIITATVTQGGQPVADGTAVEFSTTLGTFTDTGLRTTIRTTTNGVATATLTSGAPGAATVSVVVANVSQNAVVTFGATPTGPPPPVSTTPTISSVTPSVGSPEGNEIITITGTNFRQPARVVFDFGNGRTPVEAFITSLTPTQIQVSTPRVNLAPGEVAAATIRVFVDAGLPTEQVATAQFTFMPAVLTPAIVTVSPDSGPLEGGTRVTIFGSGFQDPVQVFFGNSSGPLWVQAAVINVTFDQIIAVSPASQNIGLATSGPVDLRVINIKSGTEIVAENVFRYAPSIDITAVGPTQGPITGGTPVTIDGHGFDDPVAVTIGGIAANPIFVSGTQIVAVTGAPLLTGCANVPGPISVTNINTGATAMATGLTFTFIVPKPIIVTVIGPGGAPITPGGTALVTVANPGRLSRITVGDRAVSIQSVANNPDGTATFTIVVPTTLTLGTVACAGGGSAPAPMSFNVVYTDLETTCSDTFANGITITPVSAPRLMVAPTSLTLTARADNPATPAVEPTMNGTGTVTVTNTGTAPLMITGAVSTPNPPFSNSAPPAAALAQCESATLTVTYQAQAFGTSATGTLAITSNGGNATVSLTGNTQ